MAHAFCTNTNGSTAAGVANCTCGLDADLDDAGTAIANTSHKCLVLASGHGIGTEADGTAGTKSVAECTAGAQTTAADGCKCGRDGVHVAQNSYCILKGESTTLATEGGQGGIASSVKPCSNTTSGAAVDAACKCGLDGNFTAVGTSIADTKFCYVSFMGVGQAEKAAAVAPAATCVNPSTATGSPAGTTAPGVFAALFAAVAFALRM